ncbi:MAG: tyrosine-type recombinase/integrase [Thermoleophilia bacterium]|nr:tyrosine-type recombinase/integrase [Thermoleophilia bacterium]
MSQAIDSYLAVRRAAGYDLRDRECHLRSFARFAQARGQTHVRVQAAIDWAGLSTHPAQRDRRLKEVIRFAKHAHAEDLRHEIPPAGIFGHHPTRQRPPFIYSPQQVQRLIEEASRLSPSDSIRPHTYRTLFALLIATGMRLSEALTLRLSDLGPHGLTIRQTKFHKSRLLPLHPTAAAGIERYLARRRAVGGTDDHLLLNQQGRPLNRKTVYSVFCRIRRRVGLDFGRARPSPRLHDFRHTWAVRALEACPDGRDRVHRHMLAVSTYLGHVHIGDTYWYLRATPLLLARIAQTSERHYQGGAL